MKGQRASQIAQQLRILADQIESGELDCSLGFRDELVAVRRKPDEWATEMIGTTVHGLALLLCGEDAAMPADSEDRMRKALGELVPKAINMQDIILGGKTPDTRAEVEKAALGYHGKESRRLLGFKANREIEPSVSGLATYQSWTDILKDRKTKVTRYSDKSKNAVVSRAELGQYPKKGKPCRHKRVKNVAGKIICIACGEAVK